MKFKFFFLLILLLSSYNRCFSQTKTEVFVSTLEDFIDIVQNDNQKITLKPGVYELKDLPSNKRVITISGSNNYIELSGVKIRELVGCIHQNWFIITGNNNIIHGGEIEDYYYNGMEEVTNFSEYNHNRDSLAYGLKGDPVVRIQGNYNKIIGLKLTTRGSFPYGYGSNYGIGAQNTFGLDKRCGILITGDIGGGYGNTLDSITLYQLAFGHGIFMQTGADSTTIKNCYIEGRMRLSDDIYNDTMPYDLPYLSNYEFPTGSGSWELPFEESYPIPHGVMYSLAEDGIRMYTNTGSVYVENCIVKQMRGGIRLYLGGGEAIVKNCLALDCQSTNYNLPAGGVIINSTANFRYGPASDFRLSRSNQNIEMTILPSPNSVGPHNIADIQGNSHTITFYRAPGPLDTNENRVIYVYGNKSTIKNYTEYTIVLDTNTYGNKVISCGEVIDYGNNTVTENKCNFDLGCNNTQNFEIVDNIGKQKGTFIYTFSVQTGENSNNSIIGLSGNSSVSTEDNLAAIIQFNENSTILAKKGNIYNMYKADKIMRWQPNASYTFKMDVDMDNQKYSVHLLQNNQEITIAKDYPFNYNWTKTSYIDKVIANSPVCPLTLTEAKVINLSDTTTTISRNLKENLISNDVNVFPNPVKDKLIINSPENLNKVYILYDIDGHIIASGKLTNSITVVDITNIPNGIYFVKIGEQYTKIYKKGEKK